MCYDAGMSDIGWNSVEISEEERPQITAEDLQEMLADLDPDDFDEPVQEFLTELEKGGDPEDLRRAATLLLQDEVDFSPDLQAAGIEPDEQLISLLLAVGADVNASNAYGQPPLHLAARYGYESIVHKLLAAGAKRHLHNSKGQLAVELAATPAIAALLALPEPDMLPPEVEDADYDPEAEHTCTCGRHECHCGGEHHHHHDGSCCHCHDDEAH